MKNRSKTLVSALNDYNQAAAELRPPRKLLSWDDIMGYTYLSEFDFLRDSSTDIMEKPWAQPAVREGMSELFKLIEARDELQRLHVEIKRLLTKMQEEEEYYLEIEQQVMAINPPLALQIKLHGLERHRFHALHRERLSTIPKLKGFEPSDLHFFRPGVGVRRQSTLNLLRDEHDIGNGSTSLKDNCDSDGDCTDNEEDERLNEEAATILSVANDPM